MLISTIPFTRTKDTCVFTSCGKTNIHLKKPLSSLKPKVQFVLWFRGTLQSFAKYSACIQATFMFISIQDKYCFSLFYSSSWDKHKTQSLLRLTAASSYHHFDIHSCILLNNLQRQTWLIQSHWNFTLHYLDMNVTKQPPQKWRHVPVWWL